MSNYSMESINTASADEILQKNPFADLDARPGAKSFTAWNSNRDASIYDTADVQNEDVKACIEAVREKTARTDYANLVAKNAHGACLNGELGKSTGYWQDSKYLPDLRKEAKEYGDKANELLKNIDVDSLSSSDYKKLADVMINSQNLGNNLEDSVRTSTTLRNVINNMAPQQTAEVMNLMPEKAKKNFLKNAYELYPEAMPNEEQLAHDTDKALQNIINNKPRPDFTEASNIRGCISQATYDVHMSHLKAMMFDKNAEMNSETPTTRQQVNANRFDKPLNAEDVNKLAYGKLNNEKTGLDFDFD